jgi:di/tricarboxylate transporter
VQRQGTCDQAFRYTLGIGLSRGRVGQKDRPYALLAGLFLLTAILGQLISNTATAFIIIPIALVAATDMRISPRPVLMSVAVAAAAAFLTPVTTPVNLMVMGPGGYRFGDYAKLGLPLLLWFFVVATVVVPLFWLF